MYEKICWLTAVAIAAAVLVSPAFLYAAEGKAKREVVFKDDFSKADLGKRWGAFGGKWSVTGGVLRQEKDGYDYGILIRKLYLKCDYRLEAKVRVVRGGPGMGLWWNVSGFKGGNNAQMLRFNGASALLRGWTQGNLFVCEKEASLPVKPTKGWNAMRLDVSNSAGKYDFYLNGRKLIDGARLHYRAGYLGLQSSMGRYEFDNVVVSVAAGTNWKVAPPVTSKPTVADVTRDSATITWQTSAPAPTRLMLMRGAFRPGLFAKTRFDGAKIVGDGESRKEHKVKLTGLTPGTQYTFALLENGKAKLSSANAHGHRFVTAPPAGKMLYRTVPVAVLAYRNVTFNKVKPVNGKRPDPARRPESWYRQLIDNHETMRYFYWTNSYFKLDVKCKYMQVTRDVDFSQLCSPTKEVYRDLKTLAQREGLRPDQFGAVLVIGGNGTYAWPWPGTPWPGGKLNLTTGCCFCGIGDTWIGTHEFHHLTEGWVSMIGYPVSGPHGYAHADQPWRHPGRYGENYDYLGMSLRDRPAALWMRLGVGELAQTDDADGDGVPDSDTRVIFDEKRGGTRANSKTSYGNGLTDLQNLTATTFTPAVRKHKHPLLKKQIDLKFPFAVFDYAYKRPKKTPKIDGRIEKGEWTEFAKTPNAVTPCLPPRPARRSYYHEKDNDYRFQSYLNWDDDYIYIAGAAPYTFLADLQFDANADGYFVGCDNVRFHVRIPATAAEQAKHKPNTPMPTPGVKVWNNIEPVQKRNVPEWDDAKYDQRDKIKWAWGRRKDGWYVFELAIPRCDKVGLVPKAGKEMSVRIWVSADLPENKRVKGKPHAYAFELFDNCQYGYFRLAK